MFTLDEKVSILETAANELISYNREKAYEIIKNGYGFEPYKTYHRSYTMNQKMNQFIEDGFIDRYTGDKLVNPGILKVFSVYYPDIFPYHPNWKMTEGHIAYWELFPTIDHVYPISMGGVDEESNWATTSMINNSIKSNWTLENLRWKLQPKGNIEDWDGMSKLFLTIVEENEELLDDKYIKQWYIVTKKFFP